MNGLRRWWQAPQTHWLRRVLFQLHLWLGVSFSLYVLVIALSGSALLLKWRAYEWFEPKYLTATGTAPLEGDALKERLAEVYAGFEISFVMPAYQPGRATFVTLRRDGEYYPHYFNQYTGEDQGIANPWPIRFMDALADMHDDLFLGPRGRQLNGMGGALFVLMSVTGLVLWWQGRSRWYEGLLIKPFDRRSLFWQIHIFLGFWGLLLMLAWGISGFQLGFPRALDPLIDWLDANPDDGERPVSWLRFFRSVHFARYGEGDWARRFWATASFLPTVMAVSGLVVWWRRVLMRR